MYKERATLLEFLNQMRVTLNFNSGIQAAPGLSLLRAETEVELCKAPMIELFCS